MAAQPQAFSENQTLVIRRATPADAEVCGSNTDETTEKHGTRILTTSEALSHARLSILTRSHLRESQFMASVIVRCLTSE